MPAPAAASSCNSLDVALGLFGGSIELSGATSKLLQDEAAAGAGTPAPQDADASALQQVFARGINASRDRNQYWQRHGRARELRDAWRKIVCADPAAAAVYYTLQERIVATLDTL
ncbi:hypothetical protein EON68_00205 [archaeon]|nr:MAG: hypothetical protein EON68_00205 [archaeon]